MIAEWRGVFFRVQDTAARPIKVQNLQDAIVKSSPTTNPAFGDRLQWILTTRCRTRGDQRDS